mmetsp:Transcript_12498/g.26338  ORF Transcript_12498/g.26338 Transcript_12498/m.26338 type:complete len:537 (-) Transcript_12498:53-1663(-)|eukprot:CAMPEP_0118948578 /NCGR_PEP_ID=MMETSP1169-20130426/48076_1 /TAXON_ID=36882 /ORGANISM="Pyramimonas obovata, Strain CCMP722" /LENGTH=536 /DNA_ID=CAMNT_0006895049 /DNA_START=35 /DNA_END=1645 /DNA_ORIENTATION=-
MKRPADHTVGDHVEEGVSSAPGALDDSTDCPSCNGDSQDSFDSDMCCSTDEDAGARSSGGDSTAAPCKKRRKSSRARRTHINWGDNKVAQFSTQEAHEKFLQEYGEKAGVTKWIRGYTYRKTEDPSLTVVAYSCDHRKNGCKVKLRVEHNTEASFITYQWGEHEHSGFNGRGIHPVIRAYVNELMENKTVKPRELWNSIVDSGLVSQSVPLPDVKQLNNYVSVRLKKSARKSLGGNRDDDEDVRQELGRRGEDFVEHRSLVSDAGHEKQPSATSMASIELSSSHELDACAVGEHNKLRERLARSPRLELAKEEMGKEACLGLLRLRSATFEEGTTTTTTPRPLPLAPSCQGAPSQKIITAASDSLVTSLTMGGEQQGCAETAGVHLGSAAAAAGRDEAVVSAKHQQAAAVKFQREEMQRCGIASAAGGVAAVAVAEPADAPPSSSAAERPFAAAAGPALSSTTWGVTETLRKFAAADGRGKFVAAWLESHGRTRMEIKKEDVMVAGMKTHPHQLFIHVLQVRCIIFISAFFFWLEN